VRQLSVVVHADLSLQPAAGLPLARDPSLPRSAPRAGDHGATAAAAADDDHHHHHGDQDPHVIVFPSSGQVAGGGNASPTCATVSPCLKRSSAWNPPLSTARRTGSG